MRDFLKHYNCLGVQPLLDAVKNLIHHKNEKIDLLNEKLILSGAANKLLHRFNRCEVIIRFGQKQKSLYNLVRKQIVGGPNLIFIRYEKVNKSFIGEDENNLVNSIVVVDYEANALYLSAIGGIKATGPFTVYKPISGNRLKPRRHPHQIAER